MPHAESFGDNSPPFTIDNKHLYVNDGLLQSTEVSLLIPSLPSEPLAELWDRYRQHGYLLLKGLLPRADVLAARSAYFSALEHTGVLAPDSSPEVGKFNPTADPSDYPGIGAGATGGNARPGEGNTAENFVAGAFAQHTAAWYAGKDDPEGGIIEPGFARHPDLKAFIAKLTGWNDDTLAVRRSLLRNNTPGNKAIGVHYDQSFMRYGEPTSVTAWVPIGDVSIEGGGLVYLEGGEELGETIEAEFNQKAKEAGMTDEEMRNAFNRNMMSTGFLCNGPKEFGQKYGKRWMVSNYEAGDVVLHSPHMIHASTINKDPDGIIRLGTDLRFVDSSKPWDTRWANHYQFDDGV